jgi:hypothetical protein
MHNPASGGPLPPAAPVVIAVDGLTAGLALRDNNRFRFFSGHPRFDLLDGSRFTHVEDVRWAVKRLTHATAQEDIRSAARMQDLEL